MGSVKGASDADVVEAVKLMNEGGVKTATDALKLAVFNRLQAVEDAGGGAAVTARRTAKGIAATRAAGTNRAAGTTAVRLPTSAEEFKEIMRKEEAENT